MLARILCCSLSLLPRLVGAVNLRGGEKTCRGREEVKKKIGGGCKRGLWEEGAGRSWVTRQSGGRGRHVGVGPHARKVDGG